MSAQSFSPSTPFLQVVTGRGRIPVHDASLGRRLLSGLRSRRRASASTGVFNGGWGPGRPTAHQHVGPRGRTSRNECGLCREASPL